MYLLKKKQIFLIILLCFSLEIGTIASADSKLANSHVEKLLDSLTEANSQKQAELLRQKIWKSWLSDHPNSSAVERFSIALSYLAKSQLEKADKAFTEIIILYPEYMEAWNKRATIRYLKGDFQGSLADISEVLLRQKRHFGALSGSGLVYIALGNHRQALTSFTRLIEVDPFNKEATELISKLTQKIYGKLL